MEHLRFAPCVFMVGSDYQICFITDATGMGCVRVGDQVYRDAENGLMRWADTAHKVTLPQAVLDQARAYTICFTPLAERTPYHPACGTEVSQTFAFAPVNTEKGLRLYHLADTHSELDAPAACAEYFGGQSHLLVFNGDIANKCADREELLALYRLNDRVTGGERPILFARGNHDTRGQVAHMLPGMTGTDGGRTYFTFRTGRLWGVVLDGGEDKPDDHVEYSKTVCFHAYRQAQSAFLEEVIRRGEAFAPGIDYRIAVCHVPFTLRQEPPFDIEDAVYAHWTGCCNRLGIDMLLCGHLHEPFTIHPGDKHDAHGQRFPTVIGAGFTPENTYVGAAITCQPDLPANLRFTCPDGSVWREERL